MAALLPPRLFAPWRVEAPPSAVSLLWWAVQFALSLWLDAQPYTTKCRVIWKPLTFVVVRAACCLAFSFLPYGFGRVNPY